MTSDDVHDILDKLPPEDLPKTVLCLRYGAGITIDAIARREEEYLVIRGRENGTSDEGRAFFVPYVDILYIKLDRVLKIEDLKRLYGEKVTVQASKLDSPAVEKPAEETPVPAPAMDPAAIAKQNLLARIRAAKTAAGAKG